MAVLVGGGGWEEILRGFYFLEGKGSGA